MVQSQAQQAATSRSPNPYDAWLESEEVPVHKGFYIEDTRTVDLGWWARRECNAAFLKLVGHENVSEAHVIELAPGQTLPPFRIALDEMIYVIDGRGLTTIYESEDLPKKTFEWQKHSLFYVPTNYTYQLTNAQGNQTARLLIFSSLPLAMWLTPDPDFFFKNPYVKADSLYGPDSSDYYSEAKAISQMVKAAGAGRQDTYQRNQWYGSFFPDLRVWDKLDPFKGRGAGGHVVGIKFPSGTMSAHMSVFPAKTYKKGHRHVAGVTIIIPAGEGYSLMWKEGEDKVVVPWHEASVFVPPDFWFHQHFNVGAIPGRYLAWHPPGLAADAEKVRDRSRDQFEYPDEDPSIRERFESELTKRGLKSIMPEQAYKDRNYEWDYNK